MSIVINTVICTVMYNYCEQSELSDLFNSTDFLYIFFRPYVVP